MKNNTIRTVLVDDECPALDELTYLLSAHADIKIAGTADTAPRAIEVIQKVEPDLIFLDIQMPGDNGFSVLEALSTMPRPPLVVFATAFHEHAIQAFEENAADYILKPIAAERLAHSLARIRERIQSPSTPDAGEVLHSLLSKAGIGGEITRINVEHKGKTFLLSPDDVLFFRCEKRRILATTRKGSYPCATDVTLDRLEQRLASFPFFRPNRGDLVNLTHVRAYAPWFNGKYVLTMDDPAQTDITVTKARVRAFRSAVEI